MIRTQLSFIAGMTIFYLLYSSNTLVIQSIPLPNEGMKRHEQSFVANSSPTQKPGHTVPIINGSLSLPLYEALQNERRVGLAHKGVLVMYPGGGWGNQCHTILRAFALAVIMDRAFVIQFRNPQIIAAALEPHKVDWRPWTNIEAPGPEPRDFTHYAIDLQTFNESDMSRLATIDMIAFKTGPDFQDEFPKWSSYLEEKAASRGLYLKTAGNSLYGQIFHYLFQPTLALKTIMEEMQPKLRIDKSAPYIAIHVRTGVDEIGEDPRWTWFVNATAALQTAPDILTKAQKYFNLSDSTKWFLATDSVDFGRKLQGKFPDRIVWTDSQLSLKGGLHIDRGGTSDGALSTFYEWHMMMASDVLIQLGHSSFAANAVRVGGFQCTVADVTIPSVVDINLPLSINICSKM